MTEEEKKLVLKLLDESERMYLAELDEGSHYAHLLNAINKVRKLFGMKELVLTVIEK